MFDAEATRGAMSGWRKENYEDTSNGVGTYSRLVRENRARISQCTAVCRVKLRIHWLIGVNNAL